MSLTKYIAVVMMALLAASWACHGAMAQADGQATTPAPPVIKNVPPADSQHVAHNPGPMALFHSRGTPYEFWMACLTVVTGLIIISLLSWRLSKIKCVRADDIARPVIVVFVITAILLLMVSSFSTDQIAAPFGILGTLIGHALSRGVPAKTSDAEAGAIPETHDGAASAAGNQSKLNPTGDGP